MSFAFSYELSFHANDFHPRDLHFDLLTPLQFNFAITFNTLNNNSPTTCEQRQRIQPSKERAVLIATKNDCATLTAITESYYGSKKSRSCDLFSHPENICSTSLNTSDIIIIIFNLC